MRNFMIRAGLALGLLVGGFVTASLVACTPAQVTQACNVDQLVPALEQAALAAAELAAPGSTQDAQKAAAIAAQAHVAAVAICASQGTAPATAPPTTGP